MADPEKNHIVDPDPTWNYYTLPDSAISSTFPLTLPGQAKWLAGSLHHPTPTRCVPITLYHMPLPFVYEGPVIAVLLGLRR